MKLLIFLSILMTPLVFSHCGSDEDVDSDKERIRDTDSEDSAESTAGNAEAFQWAAAYADAFCTSSWSCGCQGEHGDRATCVTEVEAEAVAAIETALDRGLQFASDCAEAAILYWITEEGVPLHCMSVGALAYHREVHSISYCRIFQGDVESGPCENIEALGLRQFGNECVRGGMGCDFTGTCNTQAFEMLGSNQLGFHGCEQDDTDLSGELECHRGLYCNGANPDGATCELLKPEGEICSLDCECLSQQCEDSCSAEEPACNIGNAEICFSFSPESSDVPVDEEPVDEEPVDEEPVDEEPVDEEPVDVGGYDTDTN